MMGAVSCKNQGGKLYENPNNTKTAVGCYSDSVVRLNGNALFPTEETNSKNATRYWKILFPVVLVSAARTERGIVWSNTFRCFP